MSDLLSNISAELIATLIVFLIGTTVSRIPHFIKRRKFRSFFGNAMLNGNAQIVYGTISLLPSSEKSPQKKLFFKKYHDGTEIKLKASELLMTHETLRSTSYILQELAQHTKKSITVCTDEDAYTNLNSTFVSLAGPAVNEITQWALNEESNKFIRFSVPEDKKEGEWKLDVISDNEHLSFTHAPGEPVDYGIILKVRNDRFPEHFFFVCAGVGSWGTSGASWYLANHWQALQKEYKSKQFGIVVKVNRKSDTSATQVYP